MTGIATACGKPTRPLRKPRPEVVPVAPDPDVVVAIALAPIELAKDRSPCESEFERGYQSGWNSAVEKINVLLHYRKLRTEGRYAPLESPLDSEINEDIEPEVLG